MSRSDIFQEEVNFLNGLSNAQKAVLIDKLNLASEIPGTIYFVDGTNGDDSNDGLLWTSAYASINGALDNGSAGDRFYLAPGDYDEGEEVAITLDDISIIGSGDFNRNVSLLLSDTASHHLITVNANNVKLVGLGLTQTKDTYDAIRIASTVSSYKTRISGCRFDGYGQGEYAVHTGTTYDSPDVVVDNCVFRSWQTACIYANATRDIYKNNIFLTTAAKIGINYVPTTGSRPDGLILDNRFLTTDSTSAVGVSLTGTPTAGTLMIDGNKFVNFADDDHCISARTGYTGLNYLGVTAIPIT